MFAILMQTSLQDKRSFRQPRDLSIDCVLTIAGATPQVILSDRDTSRFTQTCMK